MVSSIIADVPKGLRQSLAISYLAQSGYQKFSLSKGGTYSEYYSGAQYLIRNNPGMIEEYYQQWKEERRKDIIAYTNVIEQLDNAVEDSLAFLDEPKRFLTATIRSAWRTLKNILEEVSQTEAANMGAYFREKDHYRKLQEFIFKCIYASMAEEITIKVKSGSRLLANLIKAFSRSFLTRKGTILNALQNLENIYEEVEE